MIRIRSTLESTAVALAALLLASCGEDSTGTTGPGPSGGSRSALSGLALSGGTLSPAFDPDHTTYTLAVGPAVSSVTVAASVDADGPSVTVEAAGLANGSVSIAPGAVSPAIALSTGANLVTVRTLSRDATASRRYDITVTRASGSGTKTCPTVDRGSPTDGITTITVIQAPAPCNDGALWNGWYCTVLESRANNNGVVYTVEARWNRVGANVRGSVTWVTGNNSATHWRDGQSNAPWVQDQLDTVDQVRSIDLAWGGNGTTTVPRNGYVNLSSTYADVVEHLVATGVATGVLAHFGNSGGSMMGANALANHRMHEVWDGIVLGGGPFWIDLTQTCQSGAVKTRQLIDDWTWREVDGSRPCEAKAGADPSFACMSLLGPDSVFDYPNTIVAVITGNSEAAFIAGQAQLFFDSITARSKTHDIPAAPHNVLSTQAGANVALQRLREIVDGGSSH